LNARIDAGCDFAVKTASPMALLINMQVGLPCPWTVRRRK
jgi:hypothetical protein